LIHKEATNKFDLSLKENLLVREPEEEEEVVDFRVEIERRFKKAISNQIYKFPKHEPSETESEDESELNESFESLKHVTVYDLASQNHKRKQHNQLKQVLGMAAPGQHQIKQPEYVFTDQDEEIDTSTESSDFREEENSGVPIELRVRDKSSATYKKLLNLLDKQLNAPVEEPPQVNIMATQPQQQPKKPEPQPQQAVQEQKSKPVITRPIVVETLNTEPAEPLNTEPDVEIHKLDYYKKKVERNVKSQGRNERVPYNLSDLQKQSKAISNSVIKGVKKNLSQEKVGTKIDTGRLGNSSMEKTFSYLNVSTTKGESKTTVDMSKGFQESFKKLYNSNVLNKSITPSYSKNGQFTNLRDSVLKTQENYSSANTKNTMDALYQKAKNEILNKTKVTASNPNRYYVKNSTSSMSSTKRDETPKDMARKVNFNNFYGAPDTAMEKSLKAGINSSQNNMTKKDSIRAFQIVSPMKKPTDGPIVASYDFSSQSKIVKKPSFKLEFQQREQAYRDALSSNRNRKKRTSDKFSEILNTDSGIRNSYEMHQYSSALNTSSQKNTSKKQIGFTPNATTKNLSFSKVLLSYK